MVDAEVVHDIATTLTGAWAPEAESDSDRRAQLLATARLRIFADRSSYGLTLAATPGAREPALGYEGALWSVGFIQDVTTFDDAPAAAEVDALAAIFRAEHIGGASAQCLAYAVLYAPVSYVVTADPSSLKHQRADDRPQRLEIVDPVAAVERLGLLEGELPLVAPPPGSALDAGPHFWLL